VTLHAIQLNAIQLSIVSRLLETNTDRLHHVRNAAGQGAEVVSLAER